MAKKAKLDILEITIDEKSEDKLPDDVILEEKEDEGSDEKHNGGDILSKVKGWVRKPLFWIIMISVVMLGLIAGIFISLHEGIDERGRVEQKRQTVSGMPVLVEEKIVLFEGFVVDQKDDKGNIWIVLCDVALELDEPRTAKDIDSDRVDVRDVIYTILKKETMKEGLSLEGRTHLKDMIKKDLNNLLGENQIKNIYFTRYEIN
jgi:flagellar basal body-associated protein FliL